VFKGSGFPDEIGIQGYLSFNNLAHKLESAW